MCEREKERERERERQTERVRERETARGERMKCLQTLAVFCVNSVLLP